MSTAGNQEQIELWNGKPGERWVQQQETMDRCIGPLGDAAMRAAHPAQGERALDVGCGCGDTTLALAEHVGPSGHVFGVDISAPMLARARERAAARVIAAAPIEFTEADATGAKLPEVDLAFSRFGVMFFADPLAAFHNLRRATRRLAFVAWRTVEENDWVTVPGAAIAPFVPVPPHVPRAPGPFAFADKDYLRELLLQAGFRDPSIEPLDAKVLWSLTPELADGVRFLTQMGPTARALAEAEKPARAEAIEAMRDALAPYQTPQGLQLGTAVWIVTAT